MKIKNGFKLKSLCGENIVIPVGENSFTFKSIMTLNDTGAFLFEKLNKDSSKEDLVSALMSEYDVGEDTAKNDVDTFVESLRKANILDE